MPSFFALATSLALAARISFLRARKAAAIAVSAALRASGGRITHSCGGLARTTADIEHLGFEGRTSGIHNQ